LGNYNQICEIFKDKSISKETDLLFAANVIATEARGHSKNFFGRNCPRDFCFATKALRHQEKTHNYQITQPACRSWRRYVTQSLNHPHYDLSPNGKRPHDEESRGR
jgi:hypothetical protein